MSVLIVPELDTDQWPTLGGEVCKWIEDNLSFGPGDLRGAPAVLDAEKRALIHRMYEIFPQDHEHAGRRRFRRVAVSLRKGSAKTELAAWIAAAELHPSAPVRCVGWDDDGDPIGGGVTDPYIPLIAYTEEQSEELCYGALLAILQESEVAGDFDLGLTRIIRKSGAGKAVALAGSPGPRDGARTTFQVFDETHRMTLPKQKQAHRTMLANLPKRRLADPWSLETTTAYSPGESSVAESTHDYARQVAAGKKSDSKLFFFHRQAGEGHDLETKKGVRAAVMEASGPVAEWSDVDGIVEQWDDPTADRAFLERVWLNRPVKASSRAFDVEVWKRLTYPDFKPPPTDLIVLGFDGARKGDSTALVGCHVETGHLFTLGVWEGSAYESERKRTQGEVNEAVEEAFATWNVWRMYCDPPYWETSVDAWRGEYGEERVAEWWTNRWKTMAYALRAFREAIDAGDLTHDGHDDLTTHIGNAAKKELNMRDDEGNRLWNLRKERPDSPNKIDAAMAAVLAWEARRDAVASGVLANHGPSVYEDRGVLVL